MGAIIISPRDDSYTRKDGTTSLYATLYIGRQRIRIPVGVSVKTQQWDQEHERVKGVSKDAKDANLIINNVKSRINEIFVNFRLNNRRITKEIFLKEYGSNSSYIDFWAFMEDQLKKRKGTIGESTYRAHESTLKKFREILPSLQFFDINDETIRDIRKLLKKQYGNNENTIAKNLTTLKIYILIAIRKKLMEDNPFNIERIKRTKPNQVWLAKKELIKIVELYRSNELPPNLNKVLQYFLFSCFTGFRLSDVKGFKMEQIKGDFIIINPIKTKLVNNEMVTIPITKPIRTLLKEIVPHKTEGLVFDCFADQVTNRLLKKIAETAGINKDISFHSARHTFATFFLERTDDLATLQKLLGHSDIKQTMVYVHLTEGKKVEQMHKCWDEFKI